MSRTAHQPSPGVLRRAFTPGSTHCQWGSLVADARPSDRRRDESSAQALADALAPDPDANVCDGSCPMCDPDAYVEREPLRWTSAGAEPQPLIHRGYLDNYEPRRQERR